MRRKHCKLAANASTTSVSNTRDARTDYASDYRSSGAAFDGLVLRTTA